MNLTLWFWIKVFFVDGFLFIVALKIKSQHKTPVNYPFHYKAILMSFVAGYLSLNHT